MSNKKLDVTACILSLNRPEYLREAVESLLSQTTAPMDNVIFDNGSKSEVFAAVEDYVKMGVRWQGVEATRTVFWNFRRAVAEAKTKYLFIMHDDDRLCPDFLESQIDFLEKNPDVVAVSCNAYLIDELGNRNGRLLISNVTDSAVKLYQCSGDVAMQYAGDSCIPFSPVVYRTEALRHVDLREEYEKVCDAVFFCDMADVGTVAYQSRALYECRVHAGQDSSYFSPDIINKLEQFFWTRKCKDVDDFSRLHQLLIRQHTSRNLRQFLGTLGRPKSIQQIFSEFGKIWDDGFSSVAALKIIINLVSRRLYALWKK